MRVEGYSRPAATAAAASAAAPPLLGAVVHGQRHVAPHDHLVAIGPVKLDEDVLPGNRVVVAGATTALVMPFKRATGISSVSE